MRVFTLMLVALVATACSSRASTSKPAEARAQTWGTVPIGSVYETRTVTRLEKPFVHETETTTKQTLLARSDVEASIKLEISGLPAQDVKAPLHQDDAAACEGSTVTTSDEKCTVAAGTFDCTKTTIEVKDGEATKSTVTWTTKSIPVPLKTVVTNEAMTTTTELTSVAQRAGTSG
jgi:hypothetical protein